MRKISILVAAAMLTATGLTAATPAFAAGQSSEYIDAADAFAARDAMAAKFGKDTLDPGEFVWDDNATIDSDTRVLVSLSAQKAYVFNGGELIGATTISSGATGHETPIGVFPILEKKTMYHSRKYDNAPMPFMQRIDDYGIALHAGRNPGFPASHGCIRLPAKFAAKLFKVTAVGSEVIIQA
ncbi:MAG: L,D-transpeptidase family protein [Sphingomicrobium sp.]